MGGYLNLVTRKDGAVRKTLSLTGVISRMFNPALYDGKEDVVNGLMDFYKDSPEHPCKEVRLLAPFDYGLIVFDLDKKMVFDMQGARSIQMAGVIGGGDYAWQYFLELGHREWLGNGLRDYLTGEPMAPFPEGVFKTKQTLFGWLHETKMGLWDKTPIEDGLTIKEGTLPAMRIEPPGWQFCSFDMCEGVEMRDFLAASGFAFSEIEDRVWSAWIDEHPRAA